jgi:hypothetical protein
MSATFGDAGTSTCCIVTVALGLAGLMAHGFQWL